MRLLSEYETAILKGDLSKIKLPQTSSIYLSIGIPQVFHKVDSDESDFAEDSWLYIPSETLNSIRQKMIVCSNNNIDRYFDNEPILADGFTVYPLLVNGDIKVVIVDKSDKKIKLKMSVVDCIAETLLVFQKNQKVNEEYIDNFIYTLFRSHESVDAFVKGLMGLLVNQIPNSCAGYYFDDNGIIKLRMTIGDLRRFDLLPSVLSDNTKQQWFESLSNDIHFIPAESLPNEITLLDNPPDFLYIHEGLRSEYIKNVLCCILYGDISEGTIQFLEKITSMTSKLYETQFIDTRSINDYYAQNLKKIETADIGTHLLRNIISLLDKQIIVSRVLFKRDYQQAVIVTRCPDGDYLSHEHTVMDIDESVQNILKTQDEFFIEDIESSGIHEQTIKDAVEHNVKSEYYFKEILPGDEQVVIAIGSPIKGAYLNTIQAFLKAVATAFMRCYRYQVSQLSLDAVKINEDIIKARIDLFGKLIGGYYYHIFSKLTVILGASEQIVHAVKNYDNIEDKSKLLQYAEKMKNNADNVTDDVKMIQLIMPNKSDDYSRMISCRAFIKTLPKYINGYLKHIKDTKNVDVEVENTSVSKLDFKISGEEIVDIVLPLLVEILDNFQESGKIKVMTQCELDQDRIDFSFDESLIRNVNITDIIESGFQTSCLLQVKNDSYQIKDNILRFTTTAQGVVHVQVIKQSKLFSHQSVESEFEIGAR